MVARRRAAGTIRPRLARRPAERYYRFEPTYLREALWRARPAGVAPYGTGPMRAWGDACAEPNPNPRHDALRRRSRPVRPGTPGKRRARREAAWRARTARTRLSASRSTTCTTWLRRIAGICVKRSATYDAYSDNSSSGGKRVAFVGNASDPTGRGRPLGSRRSRRNPRARALGRPGVAPVDSTPTHRARYPSRRAS